MNNLLSMKEACEYLHVSHTTLRRLSNSGKITSFRTDGGHRRYRKDDLDQYLGIRKTSADRKIIIGYCRVSTSGQIKDLERQEEVIQYFCEKQGQPFMILKDIGSGINYKRKNFLKMIEMICHYQVSIVVVNYKDRLMRFGYEILQKICELHNVEIVVLNQSDEITDEEEMVEDVLSIITVFSSRLYGKRSHKNQKIINENKKLFKERDDHGKNTKNSKTSFHKTE